MHARKELALPRTSHGEIALAGSSRLRFTHAAAPVLFAHAVVTVAKTQVVSAPLIGNVPGTFCNVYAFFGATKLSNLQLKSRLNYRCEKITRHLFVWSGLRAGNVVQG